jgi:hypothetical protein
VWLWHEGVPKPPDLFASLPYTVRGLVNKKGKYPEIEIESVDDIWNELEQAMEGKWTTGQQLYHLAPLLCDCSLLVEDWMWEVIQEYNYVQRFGVSLGNLDDASAHRLECFTIIDKEINAIMRFKNNG